MSEVKKKSGQKSLGDLTEEVFKKLYYEELLTEKQIAQQYGSYQVAVNRWRKRRGLPTVGKTGRITAKLPSLTKRQEELLIGSLLGDGHMDAPSPLSARFSEGHSLKQKGYTDWKADLLGEYVSSRYEATKHEGGKVYKSWNLQTVSTTHLRPFYDLFYKTGKRVFPASLPEKMTPFALAVWYMDDGHCKSGSNHPAITFGLDVTSLKRAMSALQGLGLKPVARLNTDGTHTIRFLGQWDKFDELVGPHIPDCMAYKRLSVDGPRSKMLQHARALSVDQAVSLYEGGMSPRDIALSFQVSVSTVKRRLLKRGIAPEKRKRDGALTSFAADALLREYTPEKWATQDEDAKRETTAEILAVLRRRGFPYPEAPNALEVLSDMKSKNTWLDGERAIRPRSYIGNKLCGAFFPDRYKASWRGGKSAFEAWYCDEDLESAIRFQLDHGDPVLPHRVLRAVTMKRRTPGLFRPLVAKHVYMTWAKPGDKVWDPCAGYGGRLLGAAAAGVMYLGTDVEPSTVAGNLALAQVLRTDAEVVESPAESFDPGPVDLVFTSPPYFDVERYGPSANQSWQQGLSFEEWCSSFLRPVVQQAHQSLKSGGYLILNVADIKVRKGALPLVAETEQSALEAGFIQEDTVWMPISSLNRDPAQAREPLLVFRK